MKKFSFLALALAAGLMMGCSDEVGNDGGGSTTGSATVGEGYMSVAINLPTTTGDAPTAAMQGTRGSVDGFDDGAASEYAVNDGQLIIFGGNTEGDATLQAIYTLNVTGFATDADDQITTSKTIPVNTTTMNGPNFFAAVVLNANGQDLGLTVGTTTLAQFEEKYVEAAEADLRKTGFMMTNSPLANVAGGSSSKAPSSVTILKYPSFDSSKIKTTAAAAEADPAANIYVERIHAKVTLSQGTINTYPEGFSTMEVDSWALDNTNKSSYLFRNAKAGDAWWAYKSTKTSSPTPEYRFIEDEEVKTGAGLYRTYWGTDRNYNTAWSAGTFNNVSATTTYVKPGTTNPLYCLENTFDTDHQTVNHTTAAIVKVKFNKGNDFYILNGDKTTINTKETVENLVKEQCQNQLEALKAEYFAGTIDGDDYTVTLSDEAGKVSVESITLGECPDVTTWTKTKEELQAAITAYIATINGDLDAQLYKGGIAYYRVLIKHFGDKDTPWADTDKVDNDSYPDVKDGAKGENQWLGRFGVVRNNWYDLSITGARELGSATVPDVTNNYDDDVRNLAVTINILSWAKRSQSVIL